MVADGRRTPATMRRGTHSHFPPLPSPPAGVIHGPPQTPYEGGTFTLDITLPDAYPFEPPKLEGGDVGDSPPAPSVGGRAR